MGVREPLGGGDLRKSRRGDDRVEAARSRSGERSERGGGQE